MTGKWPIALMDHKNRIRDDDRWKNLREARRDQNNFNRRTKQGNGVYTRDGKFQVMIKNKKYGVFKPIEEAQEKAKEITKQIYGEFAE